MDKLKMKTIDIAQDNIERIGQLFPECITEIVDETGKTKKVVDFAVLNNIFNCSVTNYPNAGGSASKSVINLPGPTSQRHVLL